MDGTTKCGICGCEIPESGPPICFTCWEQNQPRPMLQEVEVPKTTVPDVAWIPLDDAAFATRKTHYIN